MILNCTRGPNPKKVSSFCAHSNKRWSFALISPKSIAILSVFPVMIDNTSRIPAIFEYHRLCRESIDLLCFHDHNYLRICQCDHRRVDCFGHSLASDQCSACLSGGHYIRGNLHKSKDFVCLCSHCHEGRLCESSMNALGFTIDSLIISDNLAHQSTYVCLASLSFSIGLFNNLCSFVTFKLLIVPILNQCVLLSLLLQFIHMLIRSLDDVVSMPSLRVLSCKTLSYLLSIFTRATYWLTSWVALDRLYVAIFPKMLPSRNPRISIWYSEATLVILASMHTHGTLHYTFVADQLVTAACVMNSRIPLLQVTTVSTHFSIISAHSLYKPSPLHC
ncbi:unnamed protein product [Adineta ricciae]|uniref:Uncharacterized protein n=1 Tax=Adineta ricciae TaxID=249248 RepID=A0A816BII0_ADIRI|nr:unnamed protein product [Adineta ricciae]CAF1610861.1 unnamed protein product [Adineta ricciae]